MTVATTPTVTELVLLIFNGKERSQLSQSLLELGFVKPEHPGLLSSLVSVAENHHSLLVYLGTSPTIAKIRDTLRHLLTFTQNTSDFPDCFPVEARNALIGNYPGSHQNLIMTQISADGSDAATTTLAFTLDLSISNHLLDLALSQSNHPIRITLERPPTVANDLFLSRRWRENLEERISSLAPNRKDQFITDIEWAIQRLEGLCIPSPDQNPGKRTAARWAIGYHERILVARIIEALWPDGVPADASIDSLCDIVDQIRWKLFRALRTERGGEFVSHFSKEPNEHLDTLHVVSVANLAKKRGAARSRLVFLSSELERISTENAEYRYRNTSVDRSDAERLITTNVDKLRALNDEYARLSNEVHKIELRLATGEYLPPARAQPPRICDAITK